MPPNIVPNINATTTSLVQASGKYRISKSRSWDLGHIEGLTLRKVAAFRSMQQKNLTGLFVTQRQRTRASC